MPETNEIERLLSAYQGLVESISHSEDLHSMLLVMIADRDIFAHRIQPCSITSQCLRSNFQLIHTIVLRLGSVDRVSHGNFEDKAIDILTKHADRLEHYINNQLKFEKENRSILSARPSVVPIFQWKGVRVLNSRLDEIVGVGRYRLLMFGSYVTGTFHSGSDLDLAVISDFFLGMPWTKRKFLLENLISNLGSTISPLGVTEDELRANEYPSVIKTIRSNHLEIYPCI